MCSPSTEPCERGYPDLLLLSREFLNLFSPSSRSVILVGQPRQGLAQAFSCKTAWLILSTLFRTLAIFHREGLIEFFFFQYNVKMVAC